MGHQQIRIRDGQEQVGARADVCGLEVCLAGGSQHIRQLHAADGLVHAGCDQAGLGINRQGFGDLRVHDDALAVELGLFAVISLVVGAKWRVATCSPQIQGGIEGVLNVRRSGLAR